MSEIKATDRWRSKLAILAVDSLMARYRIVLHDLDGAVAEERVVDCADDDEAIDHAGWIDHPHAIGVWEGERSVARFPP
ncbi:MAG: hypothetical protein ACREEB_15255 [Caulobacteraceae bacterium]